MTTFAYLSGADPVFICGMPKSGTTLLLSLLDSHKDLLVFPEETKFLRRVASGGEKASLEFLLNETHCRFLVQGELVEKAGVRDYRSFDGEKFRAHAEAYVAQHSTDSPRCLLEAVLAAYGVALRRQPPRYWVEKTPLNEIYLERAHSLWPNAKAIYMMRDPRDVFCSYSTKHVQAGKAYSLERLSAILYKSLRYWDRAARRRPNSTHFIQYESLIAHPDREMWRVSEFLGIDFADELLFPTRMGQSWEGNSMHRQSFKSISAGSIGIHRRLLAPAEIEEMELCWSDVLERFGYDQAAGTGSSAAASA